MGVGKNIKLLGTLYTPETKRREAELLKNFIKLFLAVGKEIK